MDGMIVGTPWQSWPRHRWHLKTSWRQVHWQRTGRAFTCTPVGLNPETFYEVPGSQTGRYHWAITPWVDMTLSHSVVSSSPWPQPEKQNPKLRSSREGNENTCSETTHTQHDVSNWFTIYHDICTDFISLWQCVEISMSRALINTCVLSQARRM